MLAFMNTAYCFRPDRQPSVAHMTYPAAVVAGELRRRMPGIGIKKLHKLLYYCQGHHLAATGAPLFSESISAWDMGPVVGALWKQERDGGADAAVVDLADEAALNTVGYVLSRYGQLSGLDLERLTHSEQPWTEADKHREPGSSAQIPNESIRLFFMSATAEDEDAETSQLDPDHLRSLLAGADNRRARHARPDSLANLRSRLKRA
jgi:uncharacterized phage-associated protein